MTAVTDADDEAVKVELLLESGVVVSWCTVLPRATESCAI